jgi:multiple sugar transport system permease protein
MQTYQKRILTQVGQEWILVTPAILLYALIVFAPLVIALGMGLFEFSLSLSGPEFVGTSNFEIAVLSNQFYNAVTNTVLFVVSAVLIETLLGLGLALLVHGEFTGRSSFRAILLMPMFIAPVAVGLMFRFMLNGEMGIIPLILGAFGLSGINWLADPQIALWTIVLADIWQWTPYVMVLILGGLVSVPVAPYEAARIDGATQLDMFRDITLPYIRPIIATVVFIRAVDATKFFSKVFTMTNGGPGRATESVTFMIYREGFKFFNIGSAAAQATTVFLMIFGVIVVRLIIGQWGHDEN